MRNLVTLIDDMPVFNPECRTISAYNRLLTRDRGSKGDNDGRKKYIATKELSYVYFMTDYRSPFVLGYSESERSKKVISRLSLPEGWKPDIEVKEAIRVYSEDQDTITMKSLTETREALFVCRDLVKHLRVKIEEVVNGDKIEDKQLDAAIANLGKLLGIADKLPSTIKTIKGLEEEVGKELGRSKVARGGREINEFEK